MTDARVATAKIQVATRGTGQVDLVGDFATSRGTVRQQVAHLSGKTSYTQTFSFTFDRRPCDDTVTFTATSTPGAPKGSVSRSVKVICPAAVTKVTAVRLSRTGTAATSAITVTTENATAVRLTVRWLLGSAGAGSQTFTLSGKTSYTVTPTFTYSRVPCGTTYGVTASTSPAAASGTSTLVKKTDACTTTPS
jgi:serine/threonine-protein kinase